VPFKISAHEPKLAEPFPGIPIISANNFTYKTREEFTNEKTRKIRVYFIDAEEFNKHSPIPLPDNERTV